MSKNQNPLTKKSGLSTNVILTIVVAVVAIVVIGGVLLFSRGGGNETSGGQTVAAELLRKPDSHALVEAPDSKVTVVEFLDYQCPVCQQYYTQLTKQVEQDYAGKITFVARNFPLESAHPLARPAAQAAEAAALQGKFKEMYHAINDNYAAWAATPDGKASSDEAKARAQFDQYARQIGLDAAKFQQDMNSPQVNARIDADYADGKRAGVEGTPTIFINGKKFEANVSTFEELRTAFREQVDGELAK